MVIGKYSQWIAEIDDEELGDEEYVPHDLASVLVEVDANRLNRTAKFAAYKNSRNSPGKLIRRETVVSW